MVTTGLQTSWRGIAGMAAENSTGNSPPTKIQRLSFKVLFLHAESWKTGTQLAALRDELGSAGFVHPDRRAKHLITQD
jgi:hypothetical protein